MKIFAVGASGLIGSRLKEVLDKKYLFDNLSLETGINITDPKTLDVIKNDTEHKIVLHLAAKADVDGCETDKNLGENGDAYKINVQGIQNVIDACRQNSKKIIYISTDFVFDGENTPNKGYTEEDTPNPLNWYALTKYKGEEIVKTSGIPYIIIRLAYPYRSDDFTLKKDFVHAILGRLKRNENVMGITDHIMTPTFVDDIAFAIDKLIEKNSVGIFNVVGSQTITPYEAALLIADKFGLDKSLVQKTTRELYFKNKALRPFNLAINNDKIEKLAVKMRTFEEGLKFVI